MTRQQHSAYVLNVLHMYTDETNRHPTQHSHTEHVRLKVEKLACLVLFRNSAHPYEIGEIRYCTCFKVLGTLYIMSQSGLYHVLTM